MFEKNPDLRGANEKIAMTQDQINEYIKCREDILHFAENYYYIQTIDYGRIKIPLWDFQKKMLKILIDPSPKRHVIVLSARQMSKTTVSALYLLHSMLFSKDCNIAILANNERTSREILSRIQMAYINLPLWLQKGIVEWNKGSMLLENGVKIIAASTSSNSIRGCTISTLFIDEASFVPQHIWDDFYMSVYPTVSCNIYDMARNLAFSREFGQHTLVAMRREIDHLLRSRYLKNDILQSRIYDMLNAASNFGTSADFNDI
jgi:hypothetical protein